MRWTRVTGAVMALALLSGCAVWVQTRYPVTVSYDVSGRPASGYYCYDCHGYRYFDPYYDWCVGYGFRFAWDRHPGAVTVYRQRYVRIKEQNPTYGRYRYAPGYREDRRYRAPRDYEQWRAGPGAARPRGPGELKAPEKDRHRPGRDPKQKPDWRDRQHGPAGEPGDRRNPGGLRPGPSGGA